MKAFVAAAAAVALFGSTPLALAQNAGPPANPGVHNPAVSTSSQNNPGAPAAGANSYTEAQAKERIAAAGYNNVSGLVKDKDGIWRGTATKGSATVKVALDFQGNVVSSPQ